MKKTKICTKCKKRKKIKEFYKDKQKKDKLVSRKLNWDLSKIKGAEMKKMIVLAVLLVFCGSLCYAAETGGEGKAEDPITATCEVAAKTVTAPVEAVFGGEKRTKETQETKKDVTPKKQK